MQSVVAHLYRHAARQPDKLAVIAGDGTATYGTLAEAVRGYAAYLRRHGVRRGDVVLIRASQTLAYAVAYFGIHAAGGVVTAVERNAPGLSAIAAAVGAKFAICGAADAATLPGLTCLDGAFPPPDAEQSEPQALPALDDPADILFTTGTTGSSKGVELTHRALEATAENLIYGCGYREDTVLLVPGPLNHANPIRKLLATVVNGSTIHILNGMTNLDAFFSALDQAQGHPACCLPPAAIRTLFTLTGDTLGAYADRLDFIESATAPLPEPDKLRLCRLLPKTRLYNNYGSSEAASVCMYDYNAKPGKPGCVGKPLPRSGILIVDDAHRPIASSPEHMGLIACTGDTNMTRYVNDPEQTRQVLSGGIVYTNDMGYLDEAGYVYVVGRKDDVINVGGLKVAPTEVEAAALSIDGVEDCICIPMPHPISGQAPKLLVVLREDVAFSPAALAAALQEKLEGYKVPVRFEQVRQVARTYNGKLDRKAYRNGAAEALR